MSDEKKRIRALILNEFKRGQNAAASARNINKIEGPGVVNERTCRRWFIKFAQGDMGLDDQPRSGRPTSIDLESLRVAIEEEHTHVVGGASMFTAHH